MLTYFSVIIEPVCTFHVLLLRLLANKSILCPLYAETFFVVIGGSIVLKEQGLFIHNGTVINKTVELYADHKYGSKFAVNEDIYSTIV